MISKKVAWYLVGIVFIIAISWCVYYMFSLSSRLHSKEELVAALTDTVVIERDSKNQLTATVTAFKAKSAKDVITIKTQDNTLKWLQNTLAKYKTEINRGGSASVFSASTNVAVGSKTEITGSDTAIRVVKKDTTIYVFPQYSSKFKLDKWVSGTTLATKDSTFVTISTYNEYEAVIGEKGSFFGKKTPFVEITTLSPYDSIRTVRAFITSSPSPKRFGIGIFGGYGVTVQQKPTLVPMIGVGISYNLIRF